MTVSISAFILAGGRSSRFGSDKARAVIDDLPLVARLYRRLEERLSHVTVISRIEESYRDLGLRCVSDEIAFGGPVAGLFPIEGNCSTEWSLVVACDLLVWDWSYLDTLASRLADKMSTDIGSTINDPAFRSNELVQRFVADKSTSSHHPSAIETGVHKAIVFRRNDGVFEPFPGLYHRSISSCARKLFFRGERSMQRLLQHPSMNSFSVPWSDTLPPLTTANDRSELQRFLMSRSKELPVCVETAIFAVPEKGDQRS